MKRPIPYNRNNKRLPLLLFQMTDFKLSQTKEFADDNF